MDKDEPISPGDVVQLGPNTNNKAFEFCFLVVTDLKDWGVQGYVQPIGEKNGQPAVGQAYYRARWDEFEFVGRAIWIVDGLDDENSEPIQI